MTWHWYIAGDRELLLDLDSDHAAAVATVRLKRAVKRGQLKVARSVIIEPSNSEGKYHMLVTLKAAMGDRERVLWQLWLGSDITRELYNLMRIEKGVGSPNLLIRLKPFKDERRPDYKCHCKSKHKGLKRCRLCEVMRQLHGKDAGKAYFPLVAKVVKVRKGKLSIAWLRKGEV